VLADRKANRSIPASIAASTGATRGQALRDGRRVGKPIDSGVNRRVHKRREDRRAAASDGWRGTNFQKRDDSSVEIASSVKNKVEAWSVRSGLVRSLTIRRSVSSSSQRGRVCARPDPAGLADGG